MKSKPNTKHLQKIIMGAVLSMMPVSMLLAQYEGEWTGRGLRGPTSGDSSLFWLTVIVAVIGGIIYLINEGFPNFFSAMGGLLIIFVAAQITTGVLTALGAELHQDDSIWVFLFFLGALYLKSFYDRKKSQRK